MAPLSNALYLLIFSTINPTADAFWRTACSIVQTGRIDPILSPDTISGHVHKIAGGSQVNPYSTFDSLQTSTCSSCEIQADKSAYWTPQLYYAHRNGSFEEVPNEGMTVYKRNPGFASSFYADWGDMADKRLQYIGAGENISSTVPFPPNFKMLSGNMLTRSYDSSTLTYLNIRPVADRVSFRCINAANDIPETHYMNDTDCVNGLRAQLNFQSCWDGVNLYLENSEHVAYLSDIDSGVCPPKYPIQLPHLFFEVLYWTNDIDQSAGGEFLFSNGDTTGYSFHGDFINGWDTEVQASAVENCLYTNDGGLISACPVLHASDDINFSRDCLPQAAYWDEPVLGMLSQLPGCNPITSGPEDAPQAICPLDGNLPMSTSTVSASSRATTTFAGSYTSLAMSTDAQITTIPSTSTTSSHPVDSIVPAAPITSSRVTSTLNVSPQSSGGMFVAGPSVDSSIASASPAYTGFRAFMTNGTAGPSTMRSVTTVSAPLEVTSAIHTTLQNAAKTPSTSIEGVRSTFRKAFTA